MTKAHALWLASKYRICKERQKVALAQAEALKLQARQEDLTMWQMEKVKQSRKGSKTYIYWMASGPRGDKTQSHQGAPEDGCRSSKRRLKTEALKICLK